jgi:DNA-binding NarL/FixJ family response regulator
VDALNSPIPYNGDMKSNPISILIIEEHPIMREALCTAIAEESDLKVMEPAAIDENSFQLTVSSGHDVLFLLHKPDIILFSLGNPGLEDLQALTNLRKTLHDTPILALTRDEVTGQEQAALQHGAQAVLTKAASREELVGALRSIRSGSQIVRSPVGLLGKQNKLSEVNRSHHF